MYTAWIMYTGHPQVCYRQIAGYQWKDVGDHGVDQWWEQVMDQQKKIYLHDINWCIYVQASHGPHTKAFQLLITTVFVQYSIS